MKGKTLTNYEVEGTKKREKIIEYQKQIRSQKSESLNWRSIVRKKQNDDKELYFPQTTIESASNALILMNTKQLKKDLLSN
jgi:hypothetical protein